MSELVIMLHSCTLSITASFNNAALIPDYLRRRQCSLVCNTEQMFYSVSQKVGVLATALKKIHKQEIKAYSFEVKKKNYK